MNNSSLYDEDYYERGIETGKSRYQNYRWLPELTIPMAMSLIDYLGIKREHKILVFGCAKGYTVKALRLLYRQSWGCDISNYAINSADNNTREYLVACSEEKIVPFTFNFDMIIAKDVFEHIAELDIDAVLKELCKKGSHLFAVIPMGLDDKYVIPAYENDITHNLAKDKNWWLERFKRNGWNCQKFSYYIPGVKESWSNFKKGNGFFLLERVK